MKRFTSLKSLLAVALLAMAGGVTAQETLLSEDFSKCTGDPDNPSTKMDNMDTYTNVPGWTCVNGFVGDGNTKFGSSSKEGSITTPSVDLSDGTATYTLRFKACAWKGDATTLKVTVDGGDPQEVSGLDNSGTPYADKLAEFSLTIKGTSTSKVTIASAKASKARFFLDDIEITKLSAGQTGGPHVAVPASVSFGKVDVDATSTQSVSVKGTDLTGDLTVAVSGDDAFTCAVTSIAKDEAADASIDVTFAPTEARDYSGKLTISGGGLTEDVEIALSGTGIVISGQGTQEAPYTVADVQNLDNPKTESWVKGYIVGFVVGTKVDETTSFFSTDADSVANTNLLIADDAAEKDYAKCLPVQLPSGEVRDALNLQDNPGNLGKSVALKGTLDAYFGICGVKSVTEYLLEGVEPEPEPAGISFVKATEIADGKRYALVAEDSKVAKNLEKTKTYGYLYVDDVAVSSDGFETEETNAFTITAVDGGYTIQDSYGRYLYMTGSFNSFNVSDALPESGHVWSVSLADDGKATITNVEMSKTIQYSSEYTSFGAYADEQGTLPVLYVENGNGGGTQEPHVSASPASVSFGKVRVSTTSMVIVSVKGENLTGDLTVALSGDDAFTSEVTSITQEYTADAGIDVTFAPTEARDYSGKLTISGGGLTEDVEIALSGTGIVISGQGTQEAPYTVADVQNLDNPKTESWVKGYIVGFVVGTKVDETTSFFSTDADSVANTNLLIADDAAEKDYAKCLPVQLPKGEVRDALNLQDNPGNLGKPVALKGTLDAYFGICGLKSVTEYLLDVNVSVGGIEAGNAGVPTEVYTLGGVKVGDSIEGLQKGIYVVKQGGTVKKVLK